MTGVPTTAALRTEVRGTLEGRPTRIVYSAAGRIGIGTGVPASIGACLLGLGKVTKSDRGRLPTQARARGWLRPDPPARPLENLERRV